jgi:hypothetical protein
MVTEEPYKYGRIRTMRNGVKIALMLAVRSRHGV